MTRGDVVLDLGHAQLPNPYFKAVYRVGLDLNPNTRRDVRYDEEFVGDVMRVDELFKARRFDTVVCGELIEHLENPYTFLRKVRTVLADGGRLLISTPNPIGFPNVFAEVFRLEQFFFAHEHLYYFLPRWVNRMLSRTGFQLLEMRGVGVWTPWVAVPAPVALSYQVVYAAQKTHMPRAGAGTS